MLELNKKYTTRGGHTVILTNEDYRYNSPFLGNVKDKNNKPLRVASYYPNGRYKLDSESEFDIIL